MEIGLETRVIWPIQDQREKMMQDMVLVEDNGVVIQTGFQIKWEIKAEVVLLRVLMSWKSKWQS